MCGIAGYFGNNDVELLKSMISQLRHRGPDGFGFYNKNGVGLAHARLSIIDLKGGFQPIHNEDKTVWVVFNGEIFNYIELRQELVQKGHTFYTTSDTEVIVHLYEEYGADMVKRLNGQFAIALWNETTRHAYLFRDRVGIQPLYYGIDRRGDVYFGSEIKALLANPELRKGLNSSQIANVFTFWTTLPGDTVFEGIYELRPGHYFKFADNDYQDVEYWDHEYHQGYMDESAYSGLMYETLKRAVEIRLRSDVPVGAYLSGGIDSSVITSMISKHFDNDLRTFSIEFNDKIFDESEHQKEVIDHIGVKHTSFKCSKDDVANAFEQVVYHTEKPILRTAPVPMYLLSKMVREEGYKVVLTGEGADEVFAGYDIFRENLVRRLILNDPDEERSKSLLLSLYPWMKDRISKSGSYLKKFFGGGLDDPSVDYFSHEPRWRTTSKSHLFFSGNMRKPDFEDMSCFFTDKLAELKHPLQKAQYLEFHTLFEGYLISSQGDRMLMGNGVEGRFPFLDPKVVDFGNRLDPRLKLNLTPQYDLNEKHLLKRMSRGLIPDSIIERKKQPYMAPDAESFFREGYCNPRVNDVISPESLLKSGYFNPIKVNMLRKKFEKGMGKGFPDNMAMIGIISTQLLHRMFVDELNIQPTASNDEFVIQEGDTQ